MDRRLLQIQAAAAVAVHHFFQQHQHQVATAQMDLLESSTLHENRNY
jgi:hypothetical protein